MNLSPWRVAWERDDLEGLKGEGEDSMPFFFSSSLSLYLSLSISISLSSRASVNRAIGEMASRCWTLSGNFRSGRKGSQNAETRPFSRGNLIQKLVSPRIYLYSIPLPFPKFISSLFHSVNYQRGAFSLVSFLTLMEQGKMVESQARDRFVSPSFIVYRNKKIIFLLRLSLKGNITRVCS